MFQPFRFSSLKVDRVIVTFRDTTEKKLADEEIAKLALVAQETDNAVVLTDPEGYGLSARHVTVSTSGIVPKIDRISTVVPGR